MPALVHFGRKWLLACDDFVIISIIEIILRIPWLIASIIVTWFDIFGCNVDNLNVRLLLYVICGHHLLAVCICIATCIASSRGAVFEPQKRTLLPKILYVKCATVLCDLAIISYGTWLLFQDWDLCFQWKSFIEGSVVCAYLCILEVIIGASLSYNYLGSPLHWNLSSKVDSLQLFKKAKYAWRLRLKIFCCCAEVREDVNDCTYNEISSFLASFLNDVDLTPSDILAGLIAVSKKHEIEKRKIKWPYQSDPMLARTPVPSWMTIENALYYLRIAKSTYGWAAFYDPLYPCNLCTLLPLTRCCFFGLFQRQNSAEGGDCCSCNSSAVKRITGLSDSDILHASFRNSVYEPAFIITIDHNKKVVIIAIRGTRSFSDLITDIDLKEMSLAPGIASTTCHRGALRSALFINKKIHELQVLKTAFYENPSYTLVLTGHSLGGSIAAILGMLLSSEYPSLQCYSYAPLPALSSEAIPKTFDLVFSVIVGDDLVPRLSTYSFKELIKQIYSSLEETRLPKYKLLSSAFWRCITKKFKSSKKFIKTTEIYENKQIDIKDEPPAVKDVQPDTMLKEAHLYAPGRILYFESSEKSKHVWVTGFHFQKIIISSSVIKHHQPHQIQLKLEKYKTANEDTSLTAIQQPLKMCK